MRANAVAPGAIKTRFSELLWKEPEAGKAVASSCALLRLGEAEDVAGVVLSLASDASSYTTGETIVVDGGALVGSPSLPS
ncbi:MAG TPA: SDR family oxidoreductase [Dehalococcoidia bacterium]|nr:SDR family oxidoreductase [Dehalococcoidia bacterium]